MKRYFYAFDTADAALGAFTQLRARGISQEHITVMPGAEAPGRERAPDAWFDLMPHFGAGCVIGATAGFVVGLTAIAILHLANGPAIWMLGLFIASGAVLGAWMSAPIESRVPIDGPRALRDEIRAGRTLLVVDCDHATRKPAAVLPNRADRQLVWECVAHAPLVRATKRDRRLRTRLPPRPLDVSAV